MRQLKLDIGLYIGKNIRLYYQTPGLMMKFCPKPLESAKSYFSHRARITEMSVSSGMEAILSQKKAVAGYAAAFGGVLIIYCAAESAAASLCAVSADPSGASISGAVSASAAVLSAASEAAAEEALSLAPATVVVPLSCWAALTARWTCGSVVGV